VNTRAVTRAPLDGFVDWRAAPDVTPVEMSLLPPGPLDPAVVTAEGSARPRTYAGGRSTLTVRALGPLLGANVLAGSGDGARSTSAGSGL